MSPDAQEGTKKPAISSGLSTSFQFYLDAAVGFLPIHHIPEGLYILWALVAILQIIGVLPDTYKFEKVEIH